MDKTRQLGSRRSQQPAPPTSFCSQMALDSTQAMPALVLLHSEAATAWQVAMVHCALNAKSMMQSFMLLPWDSQHFNVTPTAPSGPVSLCCWTTKALHNGWPQEHQQTEIMTALFPSSIPKWPYSGTSSPL